MPYRIYKGTDANLRKQITNAVNMATVQTTIADNDILTVPEDCQTVALWEMTVNGDLIVDGELVIQ